MLLHVAQTPDDAKPHPARKKPLSVHMGQGVHPTEPGKVEKVPTAQLEHVADEAAPTAVEKVPAAQLVHVAEETALSAVEKAPATQRVQAADDGDPEADENVPATQFTQEALETATTVLENVPGAQRVHTVELLGAKLPAGQALHVDAPVE